jgi:hypothetical protein
MSADVLADPCAGMVEWFMARYAAFLRAVNVGQRRVAMAKARDVLTGLGLDEVSSYVNSGNPEPAVHRDRQGRRA